MDEQSPFRLIDLTGVSDLYLRERRGQEVVHSVKLN